MSELILIRHAQASFGEENYDKLSDLGHKQARLLGGFFKEKDLISPTWKNRLFIRPILSKVIKKKLGFSRLKNILSGF